MAKANRPGYLSYRQFLVRLDQGWRVDPPIYIRSRWCSRSQREETYHLILRNRGKTDLVSVDDSPEMRRFIAEQDLPLDRL